MCLAVELERVVARRDPYGRRDLEHGLETDSFFADETSALAAVTLGALADAADGFDIVPSKTTLIAVDAHSVFRVCDAECGLISVIRVVVGVLD